MLNSPPVSHPVEPPFQTYPECLAFLDRLDVSVMKLGTERIGKVLARLGNPQNRIRTVHVVGTNGKGSVTATLGAIFTAAGYRTGLFTSPHLCTVRERIQMGGKPLSEPDFLEAAKTAYAAMVLALPNRTEWLTYFEFLTLMAFWAFARHNMDVAMIEAGLGGRLDSTNVLAHPEVVVVTPISLDHMDRLGHTLPAIASEKAAVFKPNVPVITGFQQEEAMAVICSMAHNTGALLHVAPGDRFRSDALVIQSGKAMRKVFDTVRQTQYECALLGRYQVQNLALVFEALKILHNQLPVPEDAIRQGLKAMNWPARFQFDPETRLVIDGSHNAAGFKALLETLRLDFPDIPIHWGLSLLENRNPMDLLPLVQQANTASVCWIEPSEPQRFHTPQKLSAMLNEYLPTGVSANTGSLETFISVLSGVGSLKVLTGSLYTAGALLRHQSGD